MEKKKDHWVGREDRRGEKKKDYWVGGGGEEGSRRRENIDIEVEPKETYICVKFPLLSSQKV